MTPFDFKKIRPSKGQVWRLPDGLTVAVTRDDGSYFACLIVDAPEESAYPVGGYDISVPLTRFIDGGAYKLDMAGLL